MQQTLDGVARVATIVRAMKAFGYSRDEEKKPADLNEAIANTLIVAGSELKYVADVRTDFGDLPPAWCHIGDINQVVLNLVVNAAHAIADTGAERGCIQVSTRIDAAQVVINVADSGTGIPLLVGAPEAVNEPSGWMPLRTGVVATAPDRRGPAGCVRCHRSSSPQWFA